MTDKADTISNRVESRLIDGIGGRYNDAISRWIRQNGVLFARLKSISPDDPLADQKRLSILRETGAARSLASALSAAGRDSVDMIAAAMSEIETINSRGDEIGVSEE